MTKKKKLTVLFCVVVAIAIASLVVIFAMFGLLGWGELQPLEVYWAENLVVCNDETSRLPHYLISRGEVDPSDEVEVHRFCDRTGMVRREEGVMYHIDVDRGGVGWFKAAYWVALYNSNGGLLAEFVSRGGDWANMTRVLYSDLGEQICWTEEHPFGDDMAWVSSCANNEPCPPPYDQCPWGDHPGNCLVHGNGSHRNTCISAPEMSCRECWSTGRGGLEPCRFCSTESWLDRAVGGIPSSVSATLRERSCCHEIDGIWRNGTGVPGQVTPGNCDFSGLSNAIVAESDFNQCLE